VRVVAAYCLNHLESLLCLTEKCTDISEPIVNKHIVVFIKAGVCFWLFMSIVRIIFNYSQGDVFFSNLESSVLSGILFGFCIALMTYFSDRKIRIKKK